MKSKKILNFVLDEKFIDEIIKTQDLFKDFEHEYYYILPPRKHSLKQIKDLQRVRMIRIKELNSLLNRTDIGGIFLHSLYSYPIKMIAQIPSEIKVFWFAWGYDIYERPIGNPLIKLPLYRNFTHMELKKPQYLPIHIRKISNKIMKKFLTNGIHEKRTFLKAIERINFFSGILPIEFDLVKNKINFKAKRVEYKYQYPLSDEYTMKIEYNGNNILIGNSANATNNHLDILHKLSDLNINDRKLIAPLSYGGDTLYIKSVKKYGSKIFGSNWLALDQLMTLDDYQNLISSCNVGIFLIERQQAMGNINMMLRRGCKVFLSETSVIYKHLTSLGIKVFSFEKDLNQENIDTPLTEKEKRLNREITLKTCTYAAAERRFKNLYKLI